MADEALQKYADIVDGAAESLFNALKYCYMISDLDARGLIKYHNYHFNPRKSANNDTSTEDTVN